MTRALAKLLADAPADRQLVAGGEAPIGFLDYDWALNDAQHSSARACVAPRLAVESRSWRSSR